MTLDRMAHAEQAAQMTTETRDVPKTSGAVIGRLCRWFGVASKDEILLRPGSRGDPDPVAGFCWLHRQGGVTQASGRGLPPESLQRLPVTLVLHAADSSLFDVQAPPGLKVQEYPLLLEEQLLADPESQQVTKLGQACGRLQLLVCDRTLLQSWETWLAEQGLKLQRLLFDIQLMPPAENVLAWCGALGVTLVKAPQEASPGGLLSWPERHLPPLSEGWAEPHWREFANDLEELEELAAGSATATSLLKPVRRSRRLNLVLPAPLQRPLKLTVVAGLGCLLATGGYQWREYQAGQLQLTQQLGLVAGASVEQAQGRLLRQLRAQQLPLQRLAETEVLSTALSDWLEQHPEWRLLSVSSRDDSGFAAQLGWQGTGSLPSEEVLRDSWLSLAPLPPEMVMTLQVDEGEPLLILRQNRKEGEAT